MAYPFERPRARTVKGHHRIGFLRTLRHDPLMTPERFQECLSILRWSEDSFAGLIEDDVAHVRNMADGVVPIPMKLAAWLETFAKIHEALPPPLDWKRRRSNRRP